MERIEAYFAMGGFGAYVWPAFLIAAMVMVGQVVASLRSLRRREAALAEFEAGKKRRARSREP